jgi:hypothetical protein
MMLKCMFQWSDDFVRIVRGEMQLRITSLHLQDFRAIVRSLNLNRNVTGDTVRDTQFNLLSVQDIP